MSYVPSQIMFISSVCHNLCVFVTDIDECENTLVCPSGICYNEPGSYSCGSCPDGFTAQGGQCVGRSNTLVYLCTVYAPYRQYNNYFFGIDCATL